jgi:preprotein translocase SecE subunit
VAASEKDNEKTRKQPETVRDRAEKAIADASKPKRSQVNSEKAGRSKRLKILKKKQQDAKPKKEKKPRRFHITPRFIREAFKEIKLVTWPNARTTFKLTTAVIIFATVFSIMVSLVDYGFGKIFKKVFLNG